jgi:hypothetical protein
VRASMADIRIASGVAGTLVVADAVLVEQKECKVAWVQREPSVQSMYGQREGGLPAVQQSAAGVGVVEGRRAAVPALEKGSGELRPETAGKPVRMDSWVLGTAKLL